MSRYGRVTVVDGAIEYEPGKSDAAVPPGPWSLPVVTITCIVEKTLPAFPLADYFIVFSTPSADYAVPLEAFGSQGAGPVLDAVAQRLGTVLELALANSTEHAERVVFQRSR